MTETEQITALAELAGIIVNGELTEDYCWLAGFIWTVDDDMPYEIWNPLAFFDDIIPLYGKQDISVKARLYKIFLADEKFWWEFTASQLSEALLRATGKWKD